ncbi:AMP-binding protein [Dactylosporangium sp. NPDC000521]|uniref:AMP-binding protein n=1 Tax=Dactylosporangium sp. NPDC000521 TaxID=3363975 RepID=UPI0036AEAAB6
MAEGYGLSEASCASARSFPEAPRPHSVGQCPPYQQMRVVRAGADGSWEDVPAGGESGLLGISGPTVFRGYVTGRGENGHVLRCRR